MQVRSGRVQKPVYSSVRTNRGYPERYYGARVLKIQLQILHTHYPKLNPEPTIAYLESGKPIFASGAEGIFVIPNEVALVREYCPGVIEWPSRYCATIRLAIEKVSSIMEIDNLIEGNILPANLASVDRTTEKLDCIIGLQEGLDFLIIPMQLGKRHAGRSSRCADDNFSEHEFGLGLLESLSVLLTHPERFADGQELGIRNGGDAWRMVDDSYLGDTQMYISVKSHKLVISTNFRGLASQRFGIATGFVPVL